MLGRARQTNELVVLLEGKETCYAFVSFLIKKL